MPRTSLPPAADSASPSLSAAPRRFLCVHGHFYQPPRENPWLETVEPQDSAAPYHDWNDRITAECYAPNGSARILNEAREIVRITNNYARISFNFGPTLLSWMEVHAPLAYRSILDADVESAERFAGHGSALAQVFNHVIMPLASTRDKRIQIAWGMADFEHRFGRKPEGMWLAETAVDTETLELLAEAGIRFTVLAPHQCGAVRRLPVVPEPQVAGSAEGAADQAMGAEGAAGVDGAATPEALAATTPAEPIWHATPDASVDTREPYLAHLPSGRTLALFFYDGPRSRAIAFERLLDSGEGFARRMASGFRDTDDAHPQLVHVATDGESYGHHHRYGEMALAYALKFTEDEQLARLTNYGEFLAKFPPRFEARIHDNTSWSCAHGVERWRGDCGCNGGKAGWHQRWRAPLRQALDELRDALRPLLARAAAPILRDADAATLDYIHVLLDRPKQLELFLARHSKQRLTPRERGTALRILEIERQAQLMYTSCGWFFDDISGIETVQIIAYAARVLQLAGELFPDEADTLEARFLEVLAQAESNVAEEGTGATIFARRARSLAVSLEQVTAHYAISSIFTSYPDSTDLFSFHMRRTHQELTTSGRGRLINGEADITSRLTGESAHMVYSVLHFGDQNIAAVVLPVEPDHLSATEEHARFLADTRRAVTLADLPAVIRLFDRRFGAQGYSIRSLFTDEQRRVVRMILASTVKEVERRLLHLYEDHASLIHFLAQTAAPRPAALAMAARFAVDVMLRRAFETEPVDLAQIEAAIAQARADGVELDTPELSFVIDNRITSTMQALCNKPGSLAALEDAITFARAVRLLPFEANIWQAQNLWYAIWKQTHASAGVEAAVAVADEELFFTLGRLLSIAPAQLTAEAGVLFLSAP